MSTKHTPVALTPVAPLKYYQPWCDHGGSPILEALDGSHKEIEVTNGMRVVLACPLVDAAPEMAEALQALLERYAPGRTSNDLWVQQARAALAKAGL